MPVVKSFSKLELESNSANKLKLFCMAQCEPLCSIDWYFGFKPPDDTGETELSSKTADSSKNNDNHDSKFNVIYKEQLLSSAQSIVSLVNQNSADSYHWDINNYTTLFASKQNYNSGSSEIINNNLSLIENLIHLQNENLFAWFKQTSLQLPASSSSSSAASSGTTTNNNNYNNSPLELSSKQLLKELAEFTSNSGSNLIKKANVISKLELTYNKINRLFNVYSSRKNSDALNSDADYDAEFQIKCKLNPYLAKGFAYKIIQAGNWFDLDYYNNDAAAAELTNSINTDLLNQQQKILNQQMDYNTTPLNLTQFYSLINNGQQQSRANIREHDDVDMMKIRILLDSKYFIISCIT